MITITPFEDEFCQQTFTIYSINNTNPKGFNYGSVTTSEKCPKCETRNIFRLYDSKDEYETEEAYVSVYDCKCPNCGNEFDLICKLWKDEDDDEMY